VRKDVPEDLAQIVEWMLKRDLEHRAPSAAAVITALQACHDYPRDGREALVATLAQRFVGRAPIRARNVSRASHTDQTRVGSAMGNVSVGARTRTGPFGPQSSARPADHRWVWAVLASVVVIGGMVAVLLARNPSSPSADSTKAPTETSPLPAAPTPAAHPPPEAAPVGVGNADTTATGAAKASGSASLPASEPPSRVPPRRSPPPSKPSGIKEVHL